MQEYVLHGVLLNLLKEKAIFIPENRTLLISDLHLGKVNHFRRSGIPVPQKANDRNIELLIGLLQQQKPERVIFLGDLFHSHYNSEWEVFGQVLKAFPEMQFELVQGNHDIMSPYQYDKLKILVHKDQLQLSSLLLSHEPLQEFEGYNLAGHIHPAVKLRGSARQSLRLPCFHFGEKQGLMPAFGEFTGAYTITPKKGDDVFVIMEETVVKVG
ncbi:ligase-associated DNA damage response endonuclease PdeM [Fulvivirga lutea]|uniref:Ligase-associated DNA damage response endonuclease PdeM n=1 Tax=Fulvivirga lutea TaxID=2810512 RepID=A0A974WIQ0_9BACT|nr:ligase-associated DNA damage response endonuclease PdeM [Fulvivirga lutea]QSE96078.1 ligase-associated DNA damage response endonuclease PdeM [Fulvivirga lutea]